MKISVVHDQEGNILAAGWAVEGSDELEAADGETVAEFDPPEDIGRRLEVGRLGDRDRRDPSLTSVDDPLAEALAALYQLRVDVDSKTFQDR